MPEDQPAAIPNRQALIIEDNPEIAQLVTLHLQGIGIGVTHQSDGAEGLACYQQHPFDLVILDLSLPSMDGLAICHAIRHHRADIPILMLTARTSEMDRVIGLEMGADDYLTKPFGIPELLARIKALLRRAEVLQQRPPPTSSSRSLIQGDLQLDLERHQLLIKQQPVELTAREFTLLQQLMAHPGCAFSRSQLLDQVWGINHAGYEHTVNTHINRLRNKIEPDPANPIYIQTVWGVGYRFIEQLP